MFRFLLNKTTLNDYEIFKPIYCHYRECSIFSLCVSKFHGHVNHFKYLLEKFPNLVFGEDQMEKCVRELNWRILKLILKNDQKKIKLIPKIITSNFSNSVLGTYEFILLFEYIIIMS